MVAEISTTSWTETDAGNIFTPPLGWPAGMAPNQVEPTARMMMGALKRFWGRTNPTYAATQSTADSYVVTPTQAMDGIGLYEEWKIRFGIANASTSPSLTLSTFAAPVKKYSGDSIVALAANDIRAKDHSLYWDGTQFILRDPSASAGTVTSVGVQSDTSGGILFSGSPITSSGVIGGKIDPTRLLVKGSLTTSDSVLIADGAASNGAKIALLSFLNSLLTPGIPQRTFTGNTTTIFSDFNSHLYHPVGATSNTLTIAANASLAYIIGTALTIVNEPGSGPVNITMATSDTLVFAQDGTTGTRTLATPGMATAIKVTATRWMISGTGLT